MADRARGETTTGAYRVGGKSGGGSGLKKLLLLLLGLLLLALLVFALISLIGGDDEADESSGSGQLAAGGTQLLPPPPKGLGPLTGDKVTGKGVVVQSVNGNQGFFVGSSAAERVYVEWGGDVGANEASTFQPKVGEKVNLTGTVQKASGSELKRLGLPVDGEELVGQQGGFVNAEEVTAAK